jgi:hypothetical protein
MAYGEYTEKAFQMFVDIAKKQANESGKTAYILADKSGKLSVNVTDKVLKTKQKIVEEIYPDYHQ